MKKAISGLILACALGVGLAAEPVAVRSAFSLGAGHCWDLKSGHGWTASIRSLNYIGDTPWYYGFGSVTGGFITTDETIFETTAFFGWRAPVIGNAVALDLWLDLIPFGGRVENATMTFQSDGLGFQVGAGVAFVESEDVDVELRIAPVIRPYDAVHGKWNFSRSYLMTSVSVQFKQNAMIERKPWAESLR